MYNNTVHTLSTCLFHSPEIPICAGIPRLRNVQGTKALLGTDWCWVLVFFHNIFQTDISVDTSFSAAYPQCATALSQQLRDIPIAFTLTAQHNTNTFAYSAHSGVDDAPNHVPLHCLHVHIVTGHHLLHLPITSAAKALAATSPLTQIARLRILAKPRKYCRPNSGKHSP